MYQSPVGKSYSNIKQLYIHLHSTFVVLSTIIYYKACNLFYRKNSRPSIRHNFIIFKIFV